MVPLSQEPYGRLGQPASQLLNQLAILASCSGAVGKAQFVESALRELGLFLLRSRLMGAWAVLL